MRFVRSALVLGIVTVALAVPLAVLAGGGSRNAGPPTFVLGRTGGNIAPFSVRIGSDGRVTTKGPVNGAPPTSPLSSPLRNGLVKLAKAEGFFTMPTSIRCQGVLPDFASRFVTVSAGGKTRTVTVRGGCNAPFEELYAVIAAVAGAQP
jgi:hypothetical protein